MKYLLFLILILPLSIFSKDIYVPAELTLVDGAQKNILIKLPIYNRKKHIQYKEDESAKSQKVKVNDLKKIVITHNNETLIFHVDKMELFINKKKTKVGKHSFLMLVLEECENISIYLHADIYNFDTKENKFEFKSLVGPGDGQGFSYLLHRKDEVPFLFEQYNAPVIGLKKITRNKFLHYFKNDANLISYIESNSELDIKNIFEKACN